MHKHEKQQQTIEKVIEIIQNLQRECFIKKQQL